MNLTKCPALGCGKVGPEIGSCGSFLSCPKAEVPIDPTQDVVVKCGPCDLIRAIPVSLIIQGKSKVQVQCSRSPCCATVVSLKGEPSEASPAPKAKPAKKS